MSSTVIVVGLAIAAIVVAASGLALTRSGRPFLTAALTLHKLVAFGAAIAIGVIVYDAAAVAPLSRVGATATAFVGAVIVGSFATGGVVSAMTSPPRWVTWAHRIGSWAALLIAAWWGVLFLG